MIFLMEREIKLETDNLASQIKYLAALDGFTVTKVKEKVNKKYQKTDSNRNLSNKFRNKTLRVSELVELLDILDYDIYIHKR
ncbi:MAG TPA: hypothetical protein DCS44_07590 [Cyanobacteria bacterium UBA10660]|nr:putative uncharacterized protein [Clostridium sp. CAG:813]HAS94460.1 hypothetical protein [Cyanobacteria bacterium UBA10660]